MDAAAAREVFERAVAEVGRAPLLLRWWAETVGDADVSLLDEAIDANPGAWSAKRLLSLARQRVGEDRSGAPPCCSAPLRSSPTTTTSAARSDDLWRTEDSEQARQYLEPLLSIEEPLPRDLRRRARIELVEGDLEAAARALASAVSRSVQAAF